MPTSSASTATIRAWAQSEGLDVAERGRLKPEVLEAYAAANGSAANRKPAAAKKTAKAKAATTPTTPKAPVRKAPAKTAAKPAGKPFPRPKAAPAEISSPAVVPVAVDTRIADLQSAVAALTARVAKLEAAGAPSAKNRFGRKS
jgi:hypothetical protein